MDNNSRLLIIDDDEYLRERLDILLTAEDYQLEFATNGVEGLQKAKSFMPDLILLDVMMPGMNGFEVCEHIRKTPNLAEVPIIMLTALDDRDSRLRGITAGADDFLSKPPDKIELCTRIRSITRLNRYRRLLTERSRFEWAIEQLDEGFLLLNNGNEIRYMNSAARLYLGIPTEDKDNKHFLEYVETYKREPEEAWKNWPAQESQSQRYLVRPETKQERPLWLQVNVFSQNLNEQLVHLHDVSERVALRQQMWSFQMIVSHKLRTPLNAFGVLPMLLEDQEEYSQGTRKMLKILQTATERLQQQVIEVLQYADSSHLLKLNTTFPLSKLQSVITTIQEDIALNPITVCQDKILQDKTLTLSVQGIELVLRELLTNAKKFHPQQSPDIEISIKSLDTQTVTLTVSDNGQHLPTEILSQVWIPYYQHEKFFSGEIQGMGLGLAMIARMIWGSGGKCQLSNREDRVGIQVTLTLALT
ncbi:MAG: response regulator [Thiomargarita sp.]|nr:response regulator [Thiomargarita sp.]